MSLEKLVDVSRYYGSNPEYVIAGGGNTSFKDGTTLLIKASGTNLGEIGPDGFVKMDRTKLARIWEKQYPKDADEREAEVLVDMMAARVEGQENKRPSVETLLHDILPFVFVVHTHPTLGNGLGCSQDGETAVKELFGEDCLWIPVTNPGYILSQATKKIFDKHLERTGKKADIIFLQNHGVFVGSDSIDGIKANYVKIMDVMGKKLKQKPDFSNKTDDYRDSKKILSVLSECAGRDSKLAFERNNEFARLTENVSNFYPVSSPFTPDHIIYAGSDPLFIEIKDQEPLEDQIRNAWKHHLEKTTLPPKIVAVQGRGIFGIGSSEKKAALALELFTDAAKIATYSQSFGGVRFMTRDKIDFINNWEVEQYRLKVNESGNK